MISEFMYLRDRGVLSVKRECRRRKLMSTGSQVMSYLFYHTESAAH